MRYVFCWLMGALFSMQPLSSFERSNAPIFNENASHVIPFLIQKDFSNGALKSEFLLHLKTIFGIDIFVETGTNFGNTAARAAEIFETVHTVELFPEYYHLALEKFKNKKNVHVHFGNSGDVFPSMLPLCKQRTLFYLDGHWDGGDRSGKGDKNTPILEELSAIQAWGRPDAVILIDDICDFQKSLYEDRIQNSCFESYPDLKELIDAILTISPQYQICFLANALLVFPPDERVSVSSLMSACAIDRLSTISEHFSDEELLAVEQKIGSVQGVERIELENYFHAYSKFECHFGWRSFAGLWMGLILLHDQKWSQADEVFQVTAQNSLPGWRVDHYTYAPAKPY